MRAVSTCPEPAGLQDYLLGRVTEATAAAVEQHLASCPECRNRLPGLRAEDEFTATFRAEARTPEPSDPQLERLAESVRALLRAAPAGGVVSSPAAEASAHTPPPVGETMQDRSPSLLPAHQPDAIGRLGGYRILKELGRGGMGVVYKAEDPKLKRLVALKVMLPNVAASAASRQRFLREAQAMAAVRHDHVVTVFHVDEAGGVPFLAMEFLEGMTLDQWLKSGRRPTVAQILRVGREIAEGLAAEHARGLIHRDVKPGNIWLDSSHKGRVKILDFGLARAGTDDVHLTRSGAVVGTPAYMAPEQARGEPVDARCDLFSLGCVLYKVCTGVTPFTGDNTMALLTSLAVDTPKPVRDLNPGVPPGLADLVTRLLEKDPAKRAASAREVVEALQALEKQPARKPEGLLRVEAPTAAPPPVAVVAAASAPAVPAPRSTVRRRRLWVVAAAAVGLIGLAAAVGLIGLAAAVLIRIQTPQGDYVIDTDDPDFFFQVRGDAVALQDRKTNKTYTLAVVRSDKGAGEFELEASDGGDLSFRTKRFTIKRGETARLTAWFEPTRVVAMPPADKDKVPAPPPHVGSDASPLPNLPPPPKHPHTDEVWTDPKDPTLPADFRIQGEYVGDGKDIKMGCQIIALGNGQFQAVVLPGGLPGAGWDGKNKSLMQGHLEGDRAMFTPATGKRKYLAGPPAEFAATLKFPPVGQKDLSGTADGKQMTINDGGATLTLKNTMRESPTLALNVTFATVLFDGTNTAEWSGGRLDKERGILNNDGHDITSKRCFSNYTVHLEFMLPFRPAARGQGRGNSGFYQVMQYEVQILDSFGLEGKDNDCGGIYSRIAPKVNMCLPPLQWQTYDIDFTNAVPDPADPKKIAKRSRITCKHNGVVIHDNVELPGPTGGAWNQPEGTPGPLGLQGYGNPLQFRNIWIVEKK
jgi:anti-sigma factor RsiW